ncbi:MAG: invertase [Anaerosolibacter sp.]|jgi:site-specific DNA recombinase|nr:invertase [Anaerosolibacter sp.]
MRSLELQIKTYKKMIRSHPNWIFAGVFFDVESGLRRSSRTGLDKMLKKAAKGKIDYIIIKSISRLSRDTLEVLKIRLKIIRFLRERGINMHFENENLASAKMDSEFEITLRGMLAQDESRNISENIQWGFRHKFEKGDTLLQKTYTEDFMTGRKVKNVGQRSRYYVKDSHPAIISAEVLDKVQEEMARRARLIHTENGTVESSASKYNGKYLLGNLLICGDCGASYRRRMERGKVAWRCATRIEKGKDACANSPTMDEEWIKKVLGETVCENGAYDESVIRDKVDIIQIFNSYSIICYKNEEQAKIFF